MCWLYREGRAHVGLGNSRFSGTNPPSDLTLFFCLGLSIPWWILFALPSGRIILFLSFPLALFGGEVFTKGAMVFLLLLSANTMRWLTRRVIGLNANWNILAGALYMFSRHFIPD